MKIWSAKRLGIGYKRSIVGFDLRSKINFAACEDIIDYSLGGSGGTKFLVTIDSQIWSRIDAEDKSVDQNGFNLLDSINESIMARGLLGGAVLAGFDLPESLADVLSSTFGLRTLPVDLLSRDEGLGFLGYDVVDIRAQSSGMYSFDWSDKEVIGVNESISFGLNKFGLVVDESSAIMASIAFDDIVPEHAPFAPCGIWVMGPTPGQQLDREKLMEHSRLG